MPTHKQAAVTFPRGPVLAALLGTFVSWPGLADRTAAAQVVGPLAAQAPETPEPAADDGDTAAGQPRFSSAGVFGRPNREALRWLEGGRRLVELGRYTDAARALGAVLDESSLLRSDDSFLPPETPPSGDQAEWVGRSVKSEARRLIGQLSAAGREAYELQYGALARHLLSDATMAGDADALAAVSRRYFHTEAGNDATFLLGLHHFDHARPLAAALLLDRLRTESNRAGHYEPTLTAILAASWWQAGMKDAARQVLDRLEERYPDTRLQIARQEVALFADGADPLSRLRTLTGLAGSQHVAGPQAWNIFRGSPSRVAAASGEGCVLGVRWRVRTTDRPLLETLIQQFQHEDEEKDQPILPGLHPLVVGDTVLMRTVKTLQAVDFKSGKLIWEVPVDDPFDTLSPSSTESLFERGPQLERGIRLRMWADATYGTMASDGRRVFNIEDLAFDLGAGRVRGIVFQNRGPFGGRGYLPWNRLAAYEVTTGKLLWRVGGPPETAGEDLAGVFFLGPPLPLMDSLYAIAEMEGEIRLFVLDPKSGAPRWQQRLAEADRPLLTEPLRRLMGVSPSYSAAHGILVCPTSNRSVVAVDLATRSLVWGYSYQRADNRQEPDFRFIAPHTYVDPGHYGRWFDSCALLVDDYVLMTPADSDQLHCLRLEDGGLLWNVPREDTLYLACVYDQKAVLVEQERIRAIEFGRQLPEGGPAPAWGGRAVELPVGVHPSGFGFQTDNLYHLPLSSGEIMAIDLEHGRVARVARSHEGHVPGNLICCGDKIISQRLTSLDAFWELGALRGQVDRLLAQDPDDPGALVLKGQILWDEGHLGRAIECFRQAHDDEPEPLARDLLRKALVEGLRIEFAVYRNHIDQIQSLVDTPDQQAEMIRWMAAGFEGANEYSAALTQYVKLIDLDREHPGLVSVSRALSIRRDRLIQIHLARLRKMMSAEDRDELDRVTESRHRDAFAVEDLQGLGRFLDYFGALPVARQAREELAGRLADAGQFLRAERMMRTQGRSEQPEQAATALAKLADLLRTGGPAEDAAACYRLLEQRFARVACLDGRTGSQCVADLPADDPVRLAMDGPALWPVGQVQITIKDPKQPVRSSYNAQPLRFTSGGSPFFLHGNIAVDRHPAALTATDGYGRRSWQLSLADPADQNQVRVSAGFVRLCASDHLLLISIGDRLLAVDTLGTRENRGPRFLWSRDLAAADDKSAQMQRARNLMANFPGRMVGLLGHRFTDQGIAAPRAVSEEILCISQFRHLIGLDPASGETVWTRHDVKPGSDVFGDHEYVFVVPPEEKSATVLAARSGRVLGLRQVPQGRLTTLGRLVLARRQSDGHEILELYDPWRKAAVWSSRTFAPDSRISLVEQGLAAVLEKDGRLVLLDVADGRTIIDRELDCGADILRLHVVASPDCYLVFAHLADFEEDMTRTPQPINGVPGEVIKRARVYGFNGQGKELWTSPLSIEDQCLPHNQPKLLPVIALVCSYRDPLPTGRSNTATSVLCLDKRSGRILCEEDFAWRTNNFRLAGDPENKTVRMELQHAHITMAFSDEPWETSDVSQEEPKLHHALLKALRNAAVDMVSGPRGRRHVFDGPEEPEVFQPPLAAERADQAADE